MFSYVAKASASLLALTVLSLPVVYAADNVKLVLKLDKIERIKAQESSGDELYFNITQYSSVERATHYQVPDYPTHWLSDHLDKVKGVTLWQKALKNGEAVELIVSLVERDFPPWNVDDLLGSVKLKLKWENNELKKEWSIPNQSITSRVEGMANAYNLIGDGAEYHLILEVVKGTNSLNSAD